MSKRETNSFIFEEEKIPCDFFDEEDEEDKNEIKKFHDVLTNSSHKMEEDDDNKDLNNITSVSETDKVYVGEVKDETKKSQESEFENEEELNETSLTNKGIGEEEEKNHNVLDDITDNNKINRNSNDNIPNKILTEIEDEDNFLLHNENKKSITKNKENTKNKKKSKSKNKNPIFLIRKIKKRSKKIQLLRKKKGLHIFRKKDPDTIRKKIKTYFHNYLLNLLNSQIKSLNIKIVNYDFIDDITLRQKTNKKKVNKYLKLNNKFTNNVSITANRNLLFKKISQILMEEPISSKYRAYDIKNNYYLTKHILSLKKNPDIIKILYNTYAESYSKFLKSANYQNILKNIKNRDGDLYMNKFRIVSNNFISYYITANKKPKFETKKKILYKDKDKVKKSMSCKNNKLNLFNNCLNNICRLDNESQNNKAKISNFKEIFEISYSNNNISLVEEFNEFFPNSSYGEDKSNKEFKYGYKTFQLNNSSEYEIINNSYNKNINEFLSNSFEGGNGKDFFFKKDENDLSYDKKYEHDSFVYNNLSDMFDKGVILKKEPIFEEEDNSGTIYEKRTSDYSKTNESDYIQMKFNDITCKNDINNQLLLDQFKKFI